MGDIIDRASEVIEVTTDAAISIVRQAHFDPVKRANVTSWL
ncbi:hypothetical protein [Stenotrophomonas phage CM2]